MIYLTHALAFIGGAYLGFVLGIKYAIRMTAKTFPNLGKPKP